MHQLVKLRYLTPAPLPPLWASLALSLSRARSPSRQLRYYPFVRRAGSKLLLVTKIAISRLPPLPIPRSTTREHERKHLTPFRATFSPWFSSYYQLSTGEMRLPRREISLIRTCTRRLRTFLQPRFQRDMPLSLSHSLFPPLPTSLFLSPVSRGKSPL